MNRSIAGPNNILQEGIVYPPKNSKIGLPFGFSHNKIIQIAGRTYHDSSRFEINLWSNKNDKVLRFAPYFTENQVIRNSFINGSWGNHEERSGGFPFKKDSIFEILILNDNNKYRVSVNGSILLEYYHRMDSNLVNSIDINGDVELHFIRLF